MLPFFSKSSQEYFLFALQFFYLCLKSRDNFLPITNDTETRIFENTCFRIAVDGDDILRSGTPGHMLTGTRDRHCKIYIWRNNLTG